MSSEEVPAGDPFPGIPLKQVSVKRKGEKDQPKSNEVFFINENYKDTSPQFAELLKLVTKYQQTVEVLSGIGMEIADLVKHIGQTNDSNLGEGLNSLGEALALVEVNRKSKLTEVGFETWSAEIGLDQRSKEMALFERDFKKKHGDGYRDIRKLQQQKQKFHKGTTKGKAKGKAKAEAKYEETTKALTEKIAEMDAFETQKLQEVILLDRKRYAVLVSLLVKTMSALSEHSETTLASIRPHEKRWAEVSRSENSIPERLQQLINSKPVLSNSPPPSPRTSQSFETLPTNTSSEPKKDDSSKKEKEERKKKEKEEEERRKKEKKEKKGKKEDAAPVQKVQGLYQWVPRAADELAIEVGLEVTLIEEVNEEWWLCSDGTKQGLVPSNYVKKI